MNFTLGELVLVDAFRMAGWTAYWTDTFGSAPEWTLPWRSPQGPEVDHVDRIHELLQTIRVAANDAEIDYPVRHRKQAEPWDVVAWRRGAIRIVEFKQHGEDFKESQRRFAWGSSLLGLDPRIFAVVFGVITFPRSSAVDGMDEPTPDNDRGPRTPQEKKQLSYVKDRRNTYGENDKSSRKNIPRAKQRVNPANRRVVRQGMTRASGQPGVEAIEENVSDTLGRRPKSWKKKADRPLGEVLAEKLERRARDGLSMAPGIEASIARVRDRRRGT